MTTQWIRKSDVEAAIRYAPYDAFRFLRGKLCWHIWCLLADLHNATGWQWAWRIDGSIFMFATDYAYWDETVEWRWEGRQ